MAPAADGVAVEGAQDAELVVPVERPRPGPGQEGVHLKGADIGDVGIRADEAAEPPERGRVVALLFTQPLAVGDVLFDQLLEVHDRPPRSKSAT